MLTKQEMFDRAWNGLKSQGWRQCRDTIGCVYTNTEPDGTVTHCAWGWVDPEVPRTMHGSVATLRTVGCGIAAELDAEGLRFAERLQDAHDLSPSPEAMESQFRDIAAAHDLRIPGEGAC